MDSVCLGDLDVGQAGGDERGPILVLRERARDATCPLGHVGTSGVVHVGVGKDVGDRKSTTWPQYPGSLSEHDVLVGSQVDDAVGDDDVDAGVR